MRRKRIQMEGFGDGAIAEPKLEEAAQHQISQNLRPELKPSSCVFSLGGLGLNLSEPEVENPTSLLLRAILASTQDVLSPNLPLEG